MDIKNRQAVFAYKTKKGLLHRVPVIVKLLVLIPLSIIGMSLPLSALAAGIVLTALIGLLCGFMPGEQLNDLKPALFYVFLMYILSVFSALLEIRFPLPVTVFLISVFIPPANYVFLGLRLVLIVQLSALLFRSTTALEIRNSLTAIETGIQQLLFPVLPPKKRLRAKPRIAPGIALFAGFIPEIFHTWTQIDRAWRARGGKNGFLKIKTLISVLIILSLEKAAQKARTMTARGG